MIVSICDMVVLHSFITLVGDLSGTDALCAFRLWSRFIFPFFVKCICSIGGNGLGPLSCIYGHW